MTKTKDKSKVFIIFRLILDFGIKAFYIKFQKKSQISKNNGPIFSRERHIENLKEALYFIKSS